jgi:ribosomal protein S3AE
MQKKKVKKGAKKKFFEVEIPLTATKVHLYNYSPEDIDGSVVKLDLTKILRGKSLELRSKVKLEDKKLTGELLSLRLVPSYVKRVMRRGTDYVEDSFDATCKDAKLKIKPFMITRKRVSRAIRNAIRIAAKKHIIAKVKSRDTKEIFSEIMTNKFQKELSLKIKKIYPLALCEIRTLVVLEKIEK